MSKIKAAFPKVIDAKALAAFKVLPRGSTHPHEGWIDGRHYVAKLGSYSLHSSDAHVHNEFVADEVLRAAGCRVPASREYRVDFGHGKVEVVRLSEFIENGRELKKAYDQGNAAQKALIVQQIVATYPALAFIDATDTYQHHILDNVLVDPDYNLWFIDNGASFDFRARGKQKGWFWSRKNPMGLEHGYYAIRDHADDSLLRMLVGVTDEQLRMAACRYDFEALLRTLPQDYQQPALEQYARALNAWAKGETMKTVETAANDQPTLTDAECDYLEAASLLIAKAVRRIDKFIDGHKPQDTENSRTMQNFRAGVDEARLTELAKKDPTGRVAKLMDVCDDIANSGAAGFKVKVLAHLWQPTVPSTQRPGRMGNVDFRDYAFSRALLPKTKVVKTTASKAVRAKKDDAGDAITVVRGDVSKIVADAVVNAANERLAAGSGICGAIFRRAGLAALQAACDKVAPCPTGEARITPAFGIKNAKFIIHAVGPRYSDGRHGEPALLASCYKNLLQVALDNGCTSVAVPSISTGIFGYPLDAAIAIAVREVKTFVAAHTGLKVIFVVWDGGADGGKSTEAKYRAALA